VPDRKSYLGSIDEKVGRVHDRLNSFDVLLHRLTKHDHERSENVAIPDHNYHHSQTQTILIVILAIFVVCVLGGLMLALGILGV